MYFFNLHFFLVNARKRQILRYSHLENNHPEESGLVDFQYFESLVFDDFLRKTSKIMTFLIRDRVFLRALTIINKRKLTSIVTISHS